MSAEFSLGRGSGSDAIGAFGKVSPRHKAWGAVGLLAVTASYLILSFYMVVSGWTLEYLVQSLTGNLYEPVEGGFVTRMEQYLEGTAAPLVNTYVMLALNLGVLAAGVTKGIEKASNVMMPVLFALLTMFCIVSLTLPGAGDGVKFFLMPDFSKVGASTAVSAIGQAFFSLSLGMGILITYSSYFPKDSRLNRTALTVSTLDLLVAMMMGFIIFPAVTTFGTGSGSLSGTSLVFVTLPEIFVHLGATQLWSSLFFLLLTVAAFTSTISLAEVSIAMLQDRLGMSRLKACLWVILPLFALSSACSLSLSPGSQLVIAGEPVFNFLDKWATNLLLPLGSILLCVYMGWVAPEKFFRDQLTNKGTTDLRWSRINYLLVRYAAPALIAVVLVAGLI